MFPLTVRTPLAPQPTPRPARRWQWCLLKGLLLVLLPVGALRGPSVSAQAVPDAASTIDEELAALESALVAELAPSTLTPAGYDYGAALQAVDPASGDPSASVAALGTDLPPESADFVAVAPAGSQTVSSTQLRVDPDTGEFLTGNPSSWPGYDPLAPTPGRDFTNTKPATRTDHTHTALRVRPTVARGDGQSSSALVGTAPHTVPYDQGGYIAPFTVDLFAQGRAMGIDPVTGVEIDRPDYLPATSFIIDGQYYETYAAARAAADHQHHVATVTAAHKAHQRTPQRVRPAYDRLTARAADQLATAASATDAGRQLRRLPDVIRTVPQTGASRGAFWVLLLWGVGLGVLGAAQGDGARRRR